jgi:hypothetical protein
MRLLKYEEDGELTITSFDDNATPPFAILSHTWGADTEEVTFKRWTRILLDRYLLHQQRKPG